MEFDKTLRRLRARVAFDAETYPPDIRAMPGEVALRRESVERMREVCQ